MADHPMLFSAPMVRAILAGRKTQTRRIVKPQPFESGYFEGQVEMHEIKADSRGPKAFRFNAAAVGLEAVLETVFEPRLAVGDRVYGREEFSGPFAMKPKIDPPRTWSPETPIWYWADGNPEEGDWTKPKPGMHMPRWASRFTLAITDVKIERLQDISEADCMAEGIVYENVIVGCHGATGVHVEVTADRYWNGAEIGDYEGPDGFPGHESPADAYSHLWNTINGDGAWEKNPWVIAYTFTTERKNIDATATS